MVAGRISLNTRNKEVLNAILMGAFKTPDGSAALSATEADAVSTEILAQSGTAALVNVSELATRVGDDLATALDNGVAGIRNEGDIKTRREAVMRALADVADTRTWNLMIDVVAQAGKYPPGAQNLDDFVVEGERRYWLHVAIDRFTGKIVDQQLETVYE
jgi:hypothetical protein